MIVSINEQTLIFLSTALAGIITGSVYDLFRAFRINLKFNKTATYFFDMAFWIIACFVLFLSIYISGDGQIRWFVFLGYALGLCLYTFSLSHIILYIFLKLVHALKRAIFVILYIIAKPLSFIWLFLCKILRPLKKYMKSAQNKHKRFIKKTLEKFKKIGIILKKR